MVISRELIDNIDPDLNHFDEIFANSQSQDFNFQIIAPLTH